MLAETVLPRYQLDLILIHTLLIRFCLTKSNIFLYRELLLLDDQ